jgi:hypothetical protein
MDLHFLYIDPGGGSLLVQVLIASALGVMYFFKNLRMYIKAFFSRIFRRKRDKNPVS